MHGAAIALAYVAWTSDHGGPPAINWVAVFSVTFMSVAIIFGIANNIASFRRARRRPSDDEDGDSQGGGGRGGPGPDGPSGPDGDPAWWPEFERQFAAHVEGLHRSRKARV